MNIDKNISIFDGRFKAVRPAILLLDVLCDLLYMDASPYKIGTNTLAVTEKALVEIMEDSDEPLEKTALNSRIRRLIYWRARLELNGAIKYQRSNVGKYVINPLYKFNGSEKEFERAILIWNTFKPHLTPRIYNKIELERF